MFDSARIVHRRKHIYRDPDSVTHRFWTVGLNPRDDKFFPTIAEVGPGVTYRKWLADAQRRWVIRQRRRVEGGLPTQGWTQKDSTGISPKEAAESRMFIMLEWYVMSDANGEPGEVIARDPEEPVVYPANCYEEGLLTERIFPDGMPNILIGDPEDWRLAPSQSNDPAVVARWIGCYHFGFPRRVRVRMQDRNKRELPNANEVS